MLAFTGGANYTSGVSLLQRSTSLLTSKSKAFLPKIGTAQGAEASLLAKIQTRESSPLMKLSYEEFIAKKKEEFKMRRARIELERAQI